MGRWGEGGGGALIHLARLTGADGGAHGVFGICTRFTDSRWIVSFRYGARCGWHRRCETNGTAPVRVILA